VGVQQAYIERLAALTGVDARYLRDLTPGSALHHAPSRHKTRGGAAAIQGNPPPVADPVRVTEEYLAGLLLLHRPLPPEVHTELAAFTPLTPELAPLFAALLSGKELGPAEDDLAERLAAAVTQHPPLPPGQLLGEVRFCLLRIKDERARHELRQQGHAMEEVDPQTAREMGGRALEALARVNQLTIQLQKAQAQHRRQPAGSADDADSGTS
jgi:hypothetical protein